MANKTITNLKELETAKASDVLLIENATETLKITKQNLLKDFATEFYVGQEISKIELTPGPQGPKGDTGPQGPQGEPGTTTWAGITDKPTDLVTESYVQTKVDEVQAQTNAQLSQKANTSEVNSKVWSMANLGQDVKEALTGGSVAVVGENCILKDNIVNKQVTPSKFSKTSIVSKNLVDIDEGTYGYYVNHLNGTLIPQLEQYPMWVSGFIEVESGETYYTGATHGYSAWYDSAYQFISGHNQHSGEAFIVAPLNASYFRTSTGVPQLNNLHFIKSEQEETRDEFAYEFKGLKLNPSNLTDVIPNEKLSFDINDYPKLQTGKNKFNKNTVHKGYYVDIKSGKLTPEVESYPYSASDFISVIPNQTYTRHINKGNNADPMAFYDAEKLFISGGRIPNPFTTPSNAHYIRVSVPTASLDLFQVELETVSDYEEYRENISSQHLPTHHHSLNEIDGLEDSITSLEDSITSLEDSITNLEDSITNFKTSELFELNLPKDIYVAVGYPLEIYNKHVCYCGNINNFHFKWSLASGKNMGRKLVINPSESLSGKTESLTLEVYDNDLNLVVTGTSTVHYLKADSTLAPSTSKKILCIGDSLTDINTWRVLLNNRLNSEVGNKFEFIGTLGGTGLKHEGHSGWSINSYMVNSSEGWNGDYKVKVSNDIGYITPKKEYKIGNLKFEFEKKEIENGATWLYFNRISGGGFVPANGTAIEETSSVEGVSQIPYTEVAITSLNPFYNPTTNKFDATYYSNNIGAVPDYCILWLGANGVSDSINKAINEKDAQTKVNNLKSMVDTILSSWSSCKLFICYNHYWSDQSGLGNAGGTRYFDKGIDLGVFNTNKNIQATFENYNDRLILIPVGQAHDSAYNYPSKEVGINNYNTLVKELEYTDRVHPSQSTGFVQFADAIYGAFIKHL